MGRSKQKRALFFQQHPICCFCGGIEPATTIDHVPQRGMFLRRFAPEGYEFPACDACQKATANIEQLVSLVSKSWVFFNDSAPRESIQDLAKRVEAVENNFPGVINTMEVPGHEAERVAKSLGLFNEQTGDFPMMMTYTNPVIVKALLNFARKLVLALYYRHLGSPLPADGRMFFRFFTNLNLLDGQFPKDAVMELGGFPAIERQGQVLTQQFSYRYGVIRRPASGKFFAAIGPSLGVLAVSIAEPAPFSATLEVGGRQVLYPPFDWSKPDITDGNEFQFTEDLVIKPREPVGAQPEPKLMYGQDPL